MAVPPFMVKTPELVAHMREHVRVLRHQAIHNTRLDDNDRFIGTDVGLGLNFATIPVLLPREVVESVPMTGYIEVSERYMRYSEQRPGRFYVYAYDPNYAEYLYSLAFDGQPLEMYNNFTGHFEQRQYERGFRYFIEISDYEELPPLPTLYNMTKKVLTRAYPRLQFTELGNPLLE